jgi:hypothetical protein
MSMPGCGVFGLLLLAAAFAGAQETPPPAPGPAIHADAAALQKLIGSPARLAWVRDDAKLATLRTDDPRGEKEHVFRNLHDLNRPVITPSGRQIVFIVFSEWASYVVNWDGTDLKKLVEGRATHVRQDERGTEWVYWQTRDNEIRTGPLKEPGAGELVWKFSVPPRPNKTENFQTSADGLRAAANFPWPQLGMAKLPRRQDADFVKFATGCWPQLARDNSYRLLFCTDGIHDRLALFDGAGTRGRIIPINPGPYPKRHGAECHRWANDPRFLVCSDRPNEEGQTNIYLGRFSDDFTFLGDWRIVTEKGRNVEPDLWVSAAAAYPGPAARDLEPVGLNAAAEENRWPGSHAGLEFLWENLASDNQIFTPEGKPLRRCNAARRGRPTPRRWTFTAACSAPRTAPMNSSNPAARAASSPSKPSSPPPTLPRTARWWSSPPRRTTPTSSSPKPATAWRSPSASSPPALLINRPWTWASCRRARPRIWPSLSAPAKRFRT